MAPNLSTIAKLQNIDTGLKYGNSMSDEAIREYINSNQEIVIDIEYIKNDVEYYAIHLIHEQAIDFEHWENVEKFFVENNYTARWVNEEEERPSSTKIRWIEDADDVENKLFVTKSMFA